MSYWRGWRRGQSDLFFLEKHLSSAKNERISSCCIQMIASVPSSKRRSKSCQSQPQDILSSFNTTRALVTQTRPQSFHFPGISQAYCSLPPYFATDSAPHNLPTYPTPYPPPHTSPPNPSKSFVSGYLTLLSLTISTAITSISCTVNTGWRLATHLTRTQSPFSCSLTKPLSTSNDARIWSRSER